MREATVFKFRRPGQCCGLCRHMRATGKPGQWEAYECAAITTTNGKPGNLMVIPSAGTSCAYFRTGRAPAGGR